MESAVASFFLRITAIGSQHYRSVVSLAAYRAGERLQDRRLQETFNHSNRTDVVHKEIDDRQAHGVMLPGPPASAS